MEKGCCCDFVSNIKTGEHNLRDICIQPDTRSAFRVALAIFARHADYIYIANIIPTAQSTTYLFYPVVSYSVPSLSSRGCGRNLAHYFAVVAVERYWQFNDYTGVSIVRGMRARYRICLFGHNLFNGGRDSPERIPQSGSRRRHYTRRLRIQINIGTLFHNRRMQ